MAVLNALPAPEIVLGLKGKLDFYAYQGIFVVRKWPRRPKMPRTAAVTSTAAAFASLSKRLQATQGQIRDAANSAGEGTNRTWKDILTKAAYGHLIRWG